MILGKTRTTFTLYCTVKRYATSIVIGFVKHIKSSETEFTLRISLEQSHSGTPHTPPDSKMNYMKKKRRRGWWRRKRKKVVTVVAEVCRWGWKPP